MTRREAYDAIVARMHKPENRARYDALCMCNDKKNADALIEMHMKHVREFLTTLEQQYGCFINCVKCEFLVAPDHPVFAVIDNALYHKGNKELLAYYVLKNRSIPEGIVSIGDYACYFVGDRDRIPFTKLTLPESLKRIGNYAFYNAAREMTLNDGLEWIGDYAFVNNSRINNTIPDNVEHIGIGCFQNLQWCDVVITSNSKLTEIPAYAFYGIRNKSPYVHIDATNITSIGDYAFAGQWNTNYDRAYNLVAMTNTQNITQIGEYVFSADGTYMDFEFSPEISTIPAGFYMTDPLPETVTTIKAGAYGKVKDFVLPQSIELIENGAFGDGSTFIVSKGSYAESWVGASSRGTEGASSNVIPSKCSSGCVLSFGSRGDV